MKKLFAALIISVFAYLFFDWSVLVNGLNDYALNLPVNNPPEKNTNTLSEVEKAKVLEYILLSDQVLYENYNKNVELHKKIELKLKSLRNTLESSNVIPEADEDFHNLKIAEIKTRSLITKIFYKMHALYLDHEKSITINDLPQIKNDIKQLEAEADFQIELNQ